MEAYPHLQPHFDIDLLDSALAKWIELTKQREILASSLARRSSSLAWELRQIARW